MVHIGDMNAIDVMRFGIVEMNLPKTAIIKNAILHTGTKKGYVNV